MPPDFTFTLSRMDRFALEISVVSDCDSILLINTPLENWLYDDDSNGNLDARIDVTDPSSGYYDVWVGTYNGDFCDATLTLETSRTQLKK